MFMNAFMVSMCRGRMGINIPEGYIFKYYQKCVGTCMIVRSRLHKSRVKNKNIDSLLRKNT